MAICTHIVLQSVVSSFNIGIAVVGYLEHVFLHKTFFIDLQLNLSMKGLTILHIPKRNSFHLSKEHLFRVNGIYNVSFTAFVYAPSILSTNTPMKLYFMFKHSSPQRHFIIY